MDGYFKKNRNLWRKKEDPDDGPDREHHRDLSEVEASVNNVA